jgi:hypothetical protein
VEEMQEEEGWTKKELETGFKVSNVLSKRQDVKNS